MDYEVIRSVKDKSLHIIFMEGTFGVLPEFVRRLGPWRGLVGGQVLSLKPHYRHQLAEQGFVLVHQSKDDFSAEAKSLAA
jgi:hypothetical protein